MRKLFTGSTMFILHERSPCVLMSLLCNVVLHRLREKVITSQFYKVIEKCSVSDGWQI